MSQGPAQLQARFGPLDLPHVALATLPTPVERLEGISGELGVDAWIKRDDQSGPLYGGNKVRKLEFLLGDAKRRGRTSVITLGAYGSHHGLATAIYGRHTGLEVRLGLHPQPLTEHVLDQVLRHHAAGAKLFRLPSIPWTSLGLTILSAHCKPGELITLGGSSPLGSLGYVEAGLELAAQVEAGDLPAPDVVVVAAGTCGTAAGMALGFELAGLQTRVVAVRVVPATLTNHVRLRGLRAGALKLLRRAGMAATPAIEVPIELDPHELGEGYGVPTPAAEAAVARFAEEGLKLETTYTGKTAAGFLRRACAEGAGKTVLYWHTYNGVDLTELTGRADPSTLPAPFQEVLREGGRL